jgi:hypothetical protein
MAMSRWIELCEAVGINVDSMELIDIYLLGGKIIKDEPLRQLCLAKMHAEGQMNVLRPDIRDEVISELSPADRLALRERVTGVHQFQRQQTA